MKQTEIHWMNNMLVRNWVREGMQNKKKNTTSNNHQALQTSYEFS